MSTKTKRQRESQGTDQLSAIVRLIFNAKREDLRAVARLLQIIAETESSAEREGLFDLLSEVFSRTGSKLIDLDDAQGSLAPDKRKRSERFQRSVGTAVRMRREDLGWTQRKLSEETGLPQSHISRIERGKLAATGYTIAKLAKALGVRRCDLDPGYRD